jgi:hypothetical protein
MDAAQRQRFLGLVVAETERLTRLVNQVLDMAKIEAGHAEWRSAAVDLRALVMQAAQTTAEVFRERGAAVEVEMPEHVPPLEADPDRLLQVLLNLLSNAAKFVPQNTGACASACAPTPSRSASRSRTTGRACRPTSSSSCSRSSARAATRPTARRAPASACRSAAASSSTSAGACGCAPSRAGRLLRLRPAVAPRPGGAADADGRGASAAARLAAVTPP